MEGIGQAIQVEQASYDSGHWNGWGFLYNTYLFPSLLFAMKRRLIVVQRRTEHSGPNENIAQ